jgi:hypothetical protein
MRIINYKLSQKILDEGKIVDAWPCDVNSEGELESNGGNEMVVEHEERYYIIIGSYDAKTEKGTAYENVLGGGREFKASELPEPTMIKILKDKGEEFRTKNKPAPSSKSKR